ncbi:MAG: hypothetical protein V5B35_01670 [Candidatus Accumulibacter necessarius]|jgi:hypothetical protein|uniref:hypothetical protein n=1 Tax=Candidatus Accumulibacter necessarius TaxID=2954386 RepID=UPI002FC38493
MTTLFLTHKTSFGIPEWSQVVSALVSYAKHIYIRTGFIDSVIKYSKNDEQQWNAIFLTFNELSEAGVVKAWGVEGRDSSDSFTSVVTREQQNIAFEYLTEFDSHLKISSNHGPELTSRYVDAKADLWHMFIAHTLGCEGIVDTKGKSELVQLHELYKQDVIQKKIVRQLFNRVGVGNLSFLSAKDIIELQSEAQFLRKELDKLLSGMILQPEPPKRLVAQVVESVHKEYIDALEKIISEKSLRHSTSEAVLDVVFDITGHFIPGYGVIPAFAKLSERLSKNNQIGLVVYLNKLKNKSKVA